MAVTPSMYPRKTKLPADHMGIMGHNDLRFTDCPGAAMNYHGIINNAIVMANEFDGNELDRNENTGFDLL